MLKAVHATFAGLSITKALESGVLYAESTRDNAVLRMSKHLVVHLSRRQGANSDFYSQYGQLDLGLDDLIGTPLEKLISGASYTCASCKTAVLDRMPEGHAARYAALTVPHVTLMSAIMCQACKSTSLRIVGCVFCFPLLQQGCVAAGVLPLRSELLENQGLPSCHLTTVMPGALGSAKLLSTRVNIMVMLLGHTSAIAERGIARQAPAILLVRIRVHGLIGIGCSGMVMGQFLQAVSQDQDVELFIRTEGKRWLIRPDWAVHDLHGYKDFIEATGNVQIGCDLPLTVSGPKACAGIDFRTRSPRIAASCPSC